MGKMDAAKPAKQKSRLHITHAQNDARYVDRGMTLYLCADPDWINEVARMNHKKNGRPFEYAEGLFELLAGIKAACGISYRACEGLAIKALERGNAPDYTTIYRRINALKVEDDGSMVMVHGRKGALCLIPDGTGLSPTKRSEWIRKTHKVKHGFIRLGIMIDQDTREILAFSITDEHTGDSPQFEGLLEGSLEKIGIGGTESEGQDAAARNPDITVKADGGYDSRKIFSYCKKRGVEPLIRIRGNSNTRSNGVDRSRTNAVLDQLGGGITDPKKFAALNTGKREENREQWKIRVGFGKRWNVEIVFSAFKRIFGDAVWAAKWKNIKQEIRIKIWLYNRMLRASQEAIART